MRTAATVSGGRRLGSLYFEGYRSSSEATAGVSFSRSVSS